MISTSMYETILRNIFVNNNNNNYNNNNNCSLNWIFRLHCVFTTGFLVFSSLIVSCRQFFSEPIDCVRGKNNIPENILNLYCWTHSTFTIETPPPPPDAPTRQFTSILGVGNSEGHEKTYHTYYQWVSFALMIQAFCFHFPYYLWRTFENGYISKLAANVKKRQVKQYLYERIGSNRLLFMKYFLCESLCALNVIGQLLLTNRFLDGEFLNYGFSILKYTFSLRDGQKHVDRDPMIKMFPRMTKCTFYTYGFSGDLQKHDSLCILPINVFNEKIYMIFWFWLIILLLMFTLLFVERVAFSLFPRIRYISFIFGEEGTARTSITRKHIQYILRKGNIGDWFLLKQLQIHINDLFVFQALINEMYSKFIKENNF